MYAAKVKASVNPKPAKSVSSTPISKGDKREATSPLDTADFDSKKIRHHSEESISLLEGVVLGAHAIEENVENVENVAVEPEYVHFLSQPIVPSDIVGIASELRSLMLPEISKLFKEQLPHIQTIVNTVVSEATGALKDEIQYLRLSEAVPMRPFFRAKNGGRCRMHHTRGRNLRGKYIFYLFDLTD